MTIFKAEGPSRKTGHWIVRSRRAHLTGRVRPPIADNVATIQFNINTSIGTRNEGTGCACFSVHGQLACGGILISPCFVETNITFGASGPKFHAVFRRLANDKRIALNATERLLQKGVRETFSTVLVRIARHNKRRRRFVWRLTSTRIHRLFVLADVNQSQGLITGGCRCYCSLLQMPTHTTRLVEEGLLFLLYFSCCSQRFPIAPGPYQEEAQ